METTRNRHVEMSRKPWKPLSYRETENGFLSRAAIRHGLATWPDCASASAFGYGLRLADQHSPPEKNDDR